MCIGSIFSFQFFFQFYSLTIDFLNWELWFFLIWYFQSYDPGHEFCKLAWVLIFFLDFFSFLVSLLDAGFKKNRFHGILLYLFFIDLSRSYELARGFDELIEVVRALFLPFNNYFFFFWIIMCYWFFLFHLLIFNLLIIDLCGFLISSVFDQMVRDTGFIS